MSATLPSLSAEAFAARLRSHSPEPLTRDTLEALFLHYQELRRWNQRLALIGPGTAEEVVSRHYGEALAALPLLDDPETAAPLPADAEAGHGSLEPRATRELLDIGSGAGFPGLVLAAARPDFHATLIEARQKKWAFLVSAARKAGLNCQCLNVRVGDPLPVEIPPHVDVMTMRAIKLDTSALKALCRRFRPSGRLLLWAGQDLPDLPPDLEPGRTVLLKGSDARRIVEFRRKTDLGSGPRT